MYVLSCFLLFYWSFSLVTRFSQKYSNSLFSLFLSLIPFSGCSCVERKGGNLEGQTFRFSYQANETNRGLKKNTMFDYQSESDLAIWRWLLSIRAAVDNWYTVPLSTDHTQIQTENVCRPQTFTYAQRCAKIYFATLNVTRMQKMMIFNIQCQIHIHI